MTLHTHPTLPLIWSSAERSVTRSQPVDLGQLPEGDGWASAPLAGLYGLLLRYGGVRDIAFHLRVPASGPWRSLLVGRPEADEESSALGPTLRECREALRAALAGLPGPWDRSAAAGRPGFRGEAGPPGFRGEDSGDGYEVAVPATSESGETAGAGGPADDTVVFVFAPGPRSRWSVSLRTAFTPADPQAPLRLLTHLAAFTRAGLSTPDGRVGEVAYLSAAERRLAERLNDPPRPWSGPQCIHQLVEEAARRYPGEIAVIQGPERLTFRQLDEKANAMAAALIARGVSRGDRVGILASRSAEFVVASLATLKAGAAYVPIDPLLPAARLDTLYRIGSVRLLLAEHSVQEVAAGLTGTPVAIPPVHEIEEAPAGPAQAPAVDGGDLAYMIFTSGSSGTPKGVLLDHFGRVNLLADLNDRLGIAPGDRTLVIASPSFDTSVLEIFGTLAAGAGIVLPERGRENDVDHWVELVRAERVTVWNSVPSSLTVFLRAWQRHQRGALAGEPGPLRSFLLGGDWLPLQQPAWIWAAFPGAEIYAIGGNTEASVCSTFYPVTDVRPDWQSVPYGRALTNQTVYVLDPFGGLTPPDLPGELAFGGVCVGWGYDAHPGLTAERFVPDPFGPDPGGRLYRTGDGARVRPGGYVELLGRLDQQVKIEGVRIELGEIQTCLCEQPEVAEAVVVPRRGPDDRAQSLVAFVVPAGAPGWAGAGADGVPQTALPDMLRGRVAARLPRPMVPQRFVILGSLPLNANGKIDQRALEALAAGATGAPPEDPGPSRAEDGDSIVRAVAEVWAQVLGLERLPGSDEVFADLGGGSLAAMQVASRLSAKLNTEVKVADLFSSATVREVAAIVRSSAAPARSMPALVRRRRGASP